jgi:phosphopentomutase
MKRVILLIMDSVGIGSATDAAEFGPEGCTDEGANTLGHIAEAFARNGAPLRLPNLTRLGLGHACEQSCGQFPAGLARPTSFTGAYAWAREVSSGKDTPSGHWEIAGVPVLFHWSYFPKDTNCFPLEILGKLGERSGVHGSLGNCHASGTEIITRLGDQHLATGTPIYYTSADSVFQIACHQDHFGLARLLELCQAARVVLDESNLKIGRVIARPFLGSSSAGFLRTGNRHDYSVPPPSPTVLQRLCEQGGSVIGIGKIGDIYAHTGLTEEVRASGHPALWRETLSALERTGDRSIVMTNFVDFDALYGHRRDVTGYGRALEEFDRRLPELLDVLHPGDLLIITADHGNDPTWPGTDHTREHIPILVHGAGVSPGLFLGARESFADIGQTIANYFSLPAMDYGRSLLD